MKDPESKNKEKKKTRSDLVKYSDIAFRMAGVIFLGVWGGMKLEELFELESHLLTVFTSLFSVGAAIYFVIREF